MQVERSCHSITLQLLTALAVEKAPCTDLRSDPMLLPKFLQNYAGGRVRQPRTPNTSAARKSLN